jgi:hypothetical protein
MMKVILIAEKGEGAERLTLRCEVETDEGKGASFSVSPNLDFIRVNPPEPDAK